MSSAPCSTLGLHLDSWCPVYFKSWTREGGLPPVISYGAVGIGEKQTTNTQNNLNHTQSPAATAKVQNSQAQNLN